MIYNPTAGPRDVRRGLKRVRSYLKRCGWSVELQMTEKSGDAIALARAAAQASCDVVIAAGGDGTINEAVNGLVGTQTALGVLPVGTGNMWAKQLRMPTYTLTNPLRLHEAAVGLAEGTIQAVDVGQVNERYFLCWAGIGLDAQVTAEMEPRQRRTKRLGVLPYAIAAVLVARDFQGVRTRVFLDGGIVRGRTLLILVSNIQQYIGMLSVAREARMDDGLLDVFIFKGLGFSYAVRHLLKLISQRYLQDPRVVHRQACHIEVQTEWAIPVQVDGDPIGTTPVTLKVVPRALRVLVPPSTPPGLFISAVQGEES
ncbi:MAG: diacylglycerol/lipid kinase family protein [Anaerolineae bacterium]